MSTLTAFWRDQSTGNRGRKLSGWLLVAFIVANEVRGIMVVLAALDAWWR